MSSSQPLDALKLLFESEEKSPNPEEKSKIVYFDDLFSEDLKLPVSPKIDMNPKSRLIRINNIVRPYECDGLNFIFLIPGKLGYLERSEKYSVPYGSSCKSPQEMLADVIKQYPWILSYFYPCRRTK